MIQGMTMGRVAYIRNRLVLMVFVLAGVTIIIFSMVRLLPGDPAFLILGERATEENAARLREQLGLNEPLPKQYWMFVSGLARGDFGNSLLYRQPVTRLVMKRVPVSIFLAVYAMTLAAIFTMTFGILAAVKKGRFADHAVRVSFLFFLTTPAFWLGLLLIMLFSLRLHWFPVAGYGKTFQEHLRYLFLPALTLALGLSAVLIRNLRGQIILVQRADYTRTARAKGVSEQGDPAEACAAKCADARRYPLRPAVRVPGRRHRRRRDRLFDPGHGAIAHPVHHRARLSGRPGDYADQRLPGHHREPAGRSLLLVPRPEGDL